jgi:hypothetical protein
MTENPITPSSVTTRPISDDDKRALAEQEAIRLGVADVTFAWAYVENYMVMLLAEILGHKTRDLASAIYFSPASLEVRIKIVDNALRRLLVNSAVAGPLLAKWTPLMNKLGQLRKTRNHVAHGQLAVFGANEGRPSFARLTAPIFAMYDEISRGYIAGQKPGMGSNELKTASRAVDRACKRILEFTEYVRLFHDAESHATLLRKLAEPEDESQGRPRPDSQSSPEP